MHQTHYDYRLPFSGWSVVPVFLIYVFFLLPTWLSIVLPLTSFFLFLNLCGLFRRQEERKATIGKIEAKNRKDLKDREFDLVLYGATGYTGRIAARYIAERYNDQIQWAIVGRKEDQLETLQKDLQERHRELKLSVLTADSNSPSSLTPIINNTRVFLSTAGPFDTCGTPIVALCAHYGTSYCDITGEASWVSEMIDEYDKVARDTGARIVHFCANDCIPWDLSAHALCRAISSVDDEVKTLSFYDEGVFSKSGGTIATIRHIISSVFSKKPKYEFDPFVKATDGTYSLYATQDRNPYFLSYSLEIGSWVGPFFMSNVNFNCVKRSNAINQYSKNMLYREYMMFPGFMSACIMYINMAIFISGLYCPPLGWLLSQAGMLPQQGKGPSDEVLKNCYLKVTGIATGANGTQMVSEMSFPTDTCYIETARMAAEAAMVLVQDGDKLPVRGGVWTPACAMGDKLLQRLQKSGTEWKIKRIE